MTDIADTGRVWVVREIATLLRVSDMTIRRRINSGEITGCKVGRAHRIHESELLAYLKRIGFTRGETKPHLELIGERQT